jgi:hypothetical protein
MYLTLIKIIAPVVLLGAYTWFIYDAGRDSVETKTVETNLNHVESVRETEHKMQDNSNQVSKDAQIQLDRLKTDLAAAGDTIDQLRDTAETYAKKLSACARPANSSAPADASAVVLAKLLSGCTQREAELAEAFDKSRIAGLACERAHDEIPK